MTFTTENFTVEFWINVDSKESASHIWIFDKCLETMEGYSVRLEGGASGTSCAVWLITNADIFDYNCRTSTTALTYDMWHHVAAIRNGTDVNDSFIFVDGQDATDSCDGLEDPWSCSQPVNIGKESQTMQWYDGMLDEIRVYARGITPAEITANYNSGLGNYAPADTTALRCWLKFYEGSGSTVDDKSTYGNDGTICNAQWTTGKAPDWKAVNSL